MKQRGASRKRMQLAAGEIAHLPKGQLWIQVISGTAWITVDRQDIIIQAQSPQMITVSGMALVSGLLQQGLVMDIALASESGEKPAWVVGFTGQKSRQEC